MERTEKSQLTGNILKMALISVVFALLTEGMIRLTGYLPDLNDPSFNVYVGIGCITALAALFTGSYQWPSVVIIPSLYVVGRFILYIILPPIIVAHNRSQLLDLDYIHETLELNNFLALLGGIIAAYSVIQLVRAFFREEKPAGIVQGEEHISSAV
jgi:hypothetical protein